MMGDVVVVVLIHTIIALPVAVVAVVVVMTVAGTVVAVGDSFINVDSVNAA